LLSTLDFAVCCNGLFRRCSRVSVGVAILLLIYCFNYFNLYVAVVVAYMLQHLFGCCCSSMFIVFQQLQPNVSAVFSLFVVIIYSRCFNFIIPMLELSSFFAVVFLYVYDVFNYYNLLLQ